MIKFFIQFLSTPLPSFLRIIIYKLIGAKIGQGAYIGPFAVLLGSKIALGVKSKIRPLSIIFSPSLFEIRAYSVISYGTIIHGESSFILGARSHVGAFNLIDLTNSVKIGEFVGLGPRSVLITHSSHRPISWGYKQGINAPIVIEDLVSIGTNSKIGHGVTIAREVQIVPNSTVLRDISSKACIVYDSPLKRILLPTTFLKTAIITPAYVKSCIIRSLKVFFDEVMLKKKYELKMGEDFCLLQKGRKVISIHLYSINSPLKKGVKNWLFGYNIEDEIFNDADDYEILDFMQLLHSSTPSKELRTAIKFFQSRFGYRFADYKHRDYFIVKPPDIINK